MTEQDQLKIIEFDASNPVHAEAFKAINYEWIEKYFKIEEPDRQSLENPQQYFIDNGGCILLAQLNGKYVGTAALKPIGAASMELCKMGVSESARGNKIGDKLGNAIVEKAKQLKINRLYLETNSKLMPALRLYKKLGFQEVMMPPTPYQRADVAMELMIDLISKQVKDEQ
jgi:N-acetylglutamate synthase-like GNAT family acetyltransferase